MVLMSLPPNLKNSGAFSPGASEGLTNFLSPLLGGAGLGFTLISSSSSCSFSESVKILARRSRCSCLT